MTATAWPTGLYGLSNVFDHVRGNLTAADLFSQGVAVSALGAAERAFPVLDPVPVVDARPLARPPALPAVPADVPIIASSLVTRAGAWMLLGVGALVLRIGRHGWSPS